MFLSEKKNSAKPLHHSLENKDIFSIKEANKQPLLFYGVPEGLEEEIISSGDYFNERRRLVSFEVSGNATDKALQVK